MANERRRMGGRGQMPVEKAKDFKGSIGKLFAYMKQYLSLATKDYMYCQVQHMDIHHSSQ